MPSIEASGRSSRATSAMVKSNSSLATKSMAGDAISDGSGSTATFGPTNPTSREGFSAFRASATLTSPAKVGELVWSTARSSPAGQGDDVGERKSGGRGVDQQAVGHDRRRLGQPRRVPEGANLPLGLIPGASAAVEALVGRRVEKECPHHSVLPPVITCARRYRGDMWDCWSRPGESTAAGAGRCVFRSWGCRSRGCRSRPTRRRAAA